MINGLSLVLLWLRHGVGGDMLKLAEGVTGMYHIALFIAILGMIIMRGLGTEWEVTYDAIEKLEKGEGTVLEQPDGAIEMPEDALRHMWSEFGIMAVKGLMDVTEDGLRNDEFPDIKPITVREVIETAWGQK